MLETDGTLSACKRVPASSAVYRNAKQIDAQSYTYREQASFAYTNMMTRPDEVQYLRFISERLLFVTCVYAT